MNKLAQLKRITEEGMGENPSKAMRHFVIFWKNSHFIAILGSHFARFRTN